MPASDFYQSVTLHLTDGRKWTLTGPAITKPGEPINVSVLQPITISEPKKMPPGCFWGPMEETMKCDKCKKDVPPDVAGANCIDCKKVYYRCPACGGAAGAQRSLHSHRALYHPKKK